MASIQARIIHKALRLQAYGWAKGTIAEQRSKQEKTARLFKIPKDVTVNKLTIGEIQAEIIECENSNNGVILYLHGGAYALGSVNVHREFLARLTKACQQKILAINYRLAPENPFPAALEDSLAAYHWLISNGFASSHIVIAGDSAGGGLAVATLLSLRDSHTPLPACAVCISPWVDLSSTGGKQNNHQDPILNPQILKMYSDYYVGQASATNPLISPLFADLQGLPPLLIQVGTNEILLDQITQFCDKARQAKMEVALDSWPGLFHVFQIIPILPETKLSLEKIANFVVNKIN